MRVQHKNDVPLISVNENRISSNSQLPPHRHEICACWKHADKERAAKMLQRPGRILCQDATAHYSMIGLSLYLLQHGRDIRAKLVKDWVVGKSA